MIMRFVFEKKDHSRSLLAVVGITLFLMLCFAYVRVGKNVREILEKCHAIRNEIKATETRCGILNEKTFQCKQSQRDTLAGSHTSMITTEHSLLKKNSPNHVSATQLYFLLQDHEKRWRECVEPGPIFTKVEPHFGFSNLLRRGRISDEMVRETYEELQEIQLLLSQLISLPLRNLQFICIQRGNIHENDLNTNRHDLFDTSGLPNFFHNKDDGHFYRIQFICDGDAFLRFLEQLQSIPIMPCSLEAISLMSSQEIDEKWNGIENVQNLLKFTVVLHWVGTSENYPHDVTENK
jgi:hypothetical protein